MLQRIISGGALFVLGLLLDGILGTIALLAAWLVAGFDVILEAIHKIGKKNFFDESFLMTIASFCAVLLGELTEAAAVMLFFQVGELFQNIAVERSRKSVASLVDLRPDVAYIMRDCQIIASDPEDVAVGDVLFVRPGERIPVDGIILEGLSSIDTSKITGESVPADVGPGDNVLSGCINLSGVLKIKAESEYALSTVARILELMDSASEGKSKTEDLINRFSRWYTPCVVLFAVVLAIIPPLFDGFRFTRWIYSALNFLVVSCPCALVISVPLAFFGGMGAASKAGIIAKGGIALETLAKVDTIVLDKTGTLTTGKSRVIRVEAPDPKRLLTLVASAEQSSGHPIARGIVEAAGELVPVSQVWEIPGQGISAVVDGHTVQAGNKRLLDELGISIPKVSGGTIVYAVIDGKFTGSIVLEDTLKKEAYTALVGLKKAGIPYACMLTGDREDAAKAVARLLPLTDYRFGLLPQDKVDAVKQMKTLGKTVAFVGDGVNDAPVMSLADVGIAMGGVGSDAAVEASDLVLLKDDLSGLPKAVQIARKTIRIAGQNIVFALVVKFGILALSILGFANMYMSVFADVGVAVLCILNSFRATKVSD